MLVARHLPHGDSWVGAPRSQAASASKDNHDRANAYPLGKKEKNEITAPESYPTDVVPL